MTVAIMLAETIRKPGVYQAILARPKDDRLEIVFGARRFRASQLAGRVGARIVISDSGCGIKSTKLAAIFEPFYTTKGSTGTGLGLWVTKQLIEKHGGTIHVRSSIGGAMRETTFRIFLPSVKADISQASTMTGEGLL